MNYFAHGRRFADQPYLLAGTAVPDWLSVVDRRVRARSRLARPWVEDKDPIVSAIASGIVQHHLDDDWFHRTRAFAELSLDFTVAIRQLLPSDDGFRPSFLGHILVELLLDATLIQDQPERLDAYYQAVDSLDVQAVNGAVNRMTTRTTGQLAIFIQQFSAERFLYDYLEDAKLLWRLNHVMRRVGLPQLTESLLDFLPSARRQVKQHMHSLLQPEKNPQGVN